MIGIIQTGMTNQDGMTMLQMMVKTIGKVSKKIKKKLFWSRLVVCLCQQKKNLMGIVASNSKDEQEVLGYTKRSKKPISII